MKVAYLLAIGQHPFAVSAGHDIHLGGLQFARAEQLGLFAAHYVMVIFLVNAQAGNDPDIVGNGGNLLANVVKAGRAR